ncbi:GNAT family N-acetyltransferase [Panacibacter sp. DH6]|uniref:GNAT family N-acetyltransferase n=1 Tax=Panacibacter microcysteis TaxID=2793269 RepID=A0A931GW28_9BACT|nr:GNAT family N-acetyltransferase [Panacibacter microcysteis]MBG9377110.1 GNAT family N-acetyltransferase [Panacibacter microcysteis]
MNFSIRKLKQADNAIIASIIRAVLTEFKANKPGTVYYDPTTDDLYTLFQTTGAVYFIATLNGKVAGGSGIFPTAGLPAGCCELVKIYLSAKARGKGIGKALMQHCFAAAKEMGYASMYLETMPELSTAVGMYEQLGFKYLDGPLGNSGHFGCDIWMKKIL